MLRFRLSAMNMPLTAELEALDQMKKQHLELLEQRRQTLTTTLGGKIFSYVHPRRGREKVRVVACASVDPIVKFKVSPHKQDGTWSERMYVVEVHQLEM